MTDDAPTQDPWPAYEGMWKLLVAATDPSGYRLVAAVNAAMADPQLRGIVVTLVGFAYSATVSLYGGDEQATQRILANELDQAQRLTRLTVADFEREDYRRDDGMPLQ